MGNLRDITGKSTRTNYLAITRVSAGVSCKNGKWEIDDAGFGITGIAKWAMIVIP